MQFVPTRDATRLTGLSTEQLREWTSRRALIPADVKPKGHGSPARYSWQTILLLRLAVTLRDRFKLELQAHRDLFSDLGSSLSRMSFLSLWGKSLALYGGQRWTLIDPSGSDVRTEDCIILTLDPHLQVLATGFALPQPDAPGQFTLFPAVGVSADGAIGVVRRVRQ